MPESYARIRAKTTTPICGGENWYLTYGFRHPLELGAVDVIMPDLQKCGGLGEGQRIANLANLYYVPMAPHMVASPLGAMGACHCCAAVPNFLCLEWHWISRWDRWNELIEEDPLIEDGYIVSKGGARTNIPGVFHAGERLSLHEPADGRVVDGAYAL